MTDIEYFFSTHSAFAYIGSRRLYEIADRKKCRVIHRPIDLNPVIDATSGEPFGFRSQAHRDYFFDREIERWAEYRNVPIINHRPTWHDEPLALPNGIVIAAEQAGIDPGPLVNRILQEHWEHDANHSDPKVLREICMSIGLEPDALLDAAASDEIQQIHRANTVEAISRNIFGSPTYFLRGDMFYGQDRLELMEYAIDKPFGGNWPK